MLLNLVGLVVFRSEDDDVHEHAVDNPEEIAAEVEM